MTTGAQLARSPGRQRRLANREGCGEAPSDLTAPQRGSPEPHEIWLPMRVSGRGGARKGTEHRAPAGIWPAHAPCVRHQGAVEAQSGLASRAEAATRPQPRPRIV